MEEYILSQFIKGSFDELVVIKNKDYFKTMEMVKTNIRANNINVQVEKKSDRTIIRRVK
jgi:hypothetical protein